MILFQLILISVQVPLSEKENVFERILFYMFSPLQHGVVGTAQKISDLWNNYFHLRDARKENTQLKLEAFRLREENLLLKQALKRQVNEDDLQRIYQDIYPFVLHARAVSWDSSNPYKSMNINKGSWDGIKKDQAVLDEFGNLVGRVSGPVNLRQARVLLLTDRRSGVSVSTENKLSVGILTGDGRNACRLIHILTTDDNLKGGDILYTTGYDGLFPPGVPVGEVVMHKKTQDLFQEVLVEPRFDLRKMDRLAVIGLDPKEVF